MKVSPEFKLIFSGDEYFEIAIDEIRRAQSEILIESYIFDFDAIGIKILTELGLAVQRGVHVKVLVDGIGSYNWLFQLSRESRKLQIPFRVYHPVPFQLKLFTRLSWKNIKRLLFLFKKMNNRNHRKVFIFDNQRALLGSINISQVHSQVYMGEKAWRDTGVFVQFHDRHTELEKLISAFFHAWQNARIFSKEQNFSASTRKRIKNEKFPQIFRLNNRPYWRLKLLNDFKNRMNSAKDRILIANAYFIPRIIVLHLLRKAARRGLFVGLMIPQHSDVWVVDLARRSLYYRLLKDGVNIFEYLPSMLHAKTLVIDNWATVGSHNLNHRSFIHDLEVETTITDPGLVETLVTQWYNNAKFCKKITMKDLGRMPFHLRLLTRVLYWFRYWL
jgi:cardiolipin synthase A/B